ncbi:TRAP transporter small permease [Alsobacter sp. R-9]
MTSHEGSTPSGWRENARRFAGLVAAWSMGVVFLLFVVGVALRLANRPVSWIDEAVTLLCTWSTFWTAAFVLRWPEHIAFDVVFTNLKPSLQRASLLIGGTAFVILMGAALPGMVDYTLFLWRERSDSLQLRLDWVYAIYPLFFAVIVLRFAWSLRELVSPRWRAELDRWNGTTAEGEQ